MLRRRLSAILVLSFLGAGVLVGARILREHPTSAPQPAVPSPAAMRAAETTLIVRHLGQKQAEVRADQVEVSRDFRYVTFKGVALVALYDRGAQTLQAQADEIVYDRRTNDLFARGHLNVISPQGYRLSAPEANWSAAQRQLTFPSGIEMRTSTSVIQAARLIVDPGLRVLVLEGSVDVAFRLPGDIP